MTILVNATDRPQRRRYLVISGLCSTLALLAASPGPALAEAFRGETAIGRNDAPVTVVEYASLTCPHCAQFHKNVLPAVKKDYVETGKVRLVYRDFPLDQLALSAAVLARCSGETRALAFVDAFYSQQTIWSRAKDPVGALKTLARLGGLDAAAADACLADKTLEDSILERRLEGQTRYEVASTPSFVIDGETHTLDSIAAFHEIIDPLLAAAAGTTAGDITVARPWARPTVAGAKVAAVSMTVSNAGTAEDRLMGAASPRAGRVELHRTEVRGGVARILPQAGGITVAGGETLRAEPGSHQLVLVGLAEPLRAGDKVPLTLTFEKAGPVEVEVAVSARPVAAASAEHEPH